MRTEQSKSQLFSSVAAAALLILAGGAGYRALAAHYARPVDSVKIPLGTLAALPMTIGDWQGSDVPLDDRIITATDTDDHINRLYTLSPSDRVALFIGYGVNLRDLAPHRPEVCYRGAGWTWEHSRHLEIDAADGSTLGCQVHHFRRGGLSADRVAILNYYIVDGDQCADVSLLRATASWQRNSESPYSAQVQIVCATSVDLEKADELVRDFAGESAPHIKSLLDSAVRAARAATASKTPQNEAQGST